VPKSRSRESHDPLTRRSLDRALHRALETLLGVGAEAHTSALPPTLISETACLLLTRLLTLAAAEAGGLVAGGWGRDRAALHGALETFADPGTQGPEVEAFALRLLATLPLPLPEEILRLLEFGWDPSVSASEAAGAAHEALLGFEIRRVQGRLVVSASSAKRKRSGAFYTSRRLTDATTRHTLRPLLETARDPLALRVCDPAMGGGAFLLSALREIARSAGPCADPRALRRAVAETCLYGVDLDPLCLELTRNALWMEVGDPSLSPRALGRGLRRGNALLGAWAGPDREARDTTCARGLFPAGALPPAGVAALARRLAFFHWELEFPEIFAEGGFDAVIGNPPWEIHKHPRSRAAGGSSAEVEVFGPEIPDPAALARLVRASITPSPPERPFHLQGTGNLNDFKLFTELGLSLLREGGQLGFLVPAGIYTDEGCTPLRRFLLDRCRLRHLRGFENRAGTFPIDRRFRFCALVAERGGRTESFRASFLERDPSAWEAPLPPGGEIPVALVRRLSPESLRVPEIRSEREGEVFTRVLDAAMRPDDPAWGLRVRTDLHMSADAHRFVRRAALERQGGLPDVFGRWRDPEGRRWLPLYEGRMVGLMDPCEKGWVRGRGRAALWKAMPNRDAARSPRPQFLVPEGTPFHEDVPKLLLMEIVSSTNARSAVAALVPPFPAGHKALVLRPARPELAPALCAVLGSFVLDFVLRCLLASNNLTWSLLRTLPLPPPEPCAVLALPAIRLSCDLPAQAGTWATRVRGERRRRGWRSLQALTPHERARLRAMIDAAVALLFGLSRQEFSWILRDCDHPTRDLQRASVRATLDPKSFWRVDRSLEPELRAPALALLAFDALSSLLQNVGDQDRALSLFFDGRWGPEGAREDPDGEGWPLPERLGPRLGPRRLSCQEREDVEASWDECERLAWALKSEGQA
jgi:hypothetical protein